MCTGTHATGWNACRSLMLLTRPRSWKWRADPLASTTTPGNNNNNKRQGGEEVAAMTTVRASSDLPPLDVNGTNSPRTRVGRGLESIGGMTADTFQRFTTVVGGVVKSPVALMAKVGSLASPQAASRTSPLSASRTSSQAVSPTLPQAKSPTSPEAASLTLPEAENPTSPQAASLTSPEPASPILAEAASLTLPEAASPILAEAASLTLPEAASPTLPETTSFNLPEPANLTLPEAASVTSSPSMSLEERVFQLEIQMKSLEERFNTGTAVTELNLSPRSLEENPRLARSLMQEMETEGTLEKRVQMLEETLHERMESVEKALSIIQSQLAHVDLSKDESVAGYNSHDSPSGELEFYDAEQQGDGLEILEILELNSIEEMIADARYESSEATDASAPLEEMPAIKTEPTTAELVQDIDAGRSGEPQLAHISMQCKQIFPTEPMEAAAPSDDGGTFPVSSDQQLVSTLSELHETFMTEPSAVTASAKILDIAWADSAEKNSIAPVFFEPQSAFVPEAFQEKQQLLSATSVANSEELAEEDVFGKSVDSESPLAPLLETPHRVSVTESLAAASSAGFAQKLAINENSDVALTPSEPQAASKFVEEPLAALLSANFEEDVAEKSGSYVLATKESPALSSCEEPHEDFAKELLAAAPSAELGQVVATNEDGYMAIASSDTEVASRFAEEPSAAIPSDHFEEPAQEDAVNMSETMLAAEESPLLASFEEPEDDFVKKSSVVAPIAEPAHGLATETSDGVVPVFSEPQVASRSVEFPSAAVPNDNAEELAQEDAAVKSGTLLAAEEAPLLSSFEEPQEDFLKESVAAAPSAGPAHELATVASDDVAPAFSEPQVASRSVEYPSTAVLNDNAEEPAQEDAQDKSGTLLAAEESPLLSSFEEPEDDTVKEALVAGASAELAHRLATEAIDDIAPAFSEPQVASRSVEEPSAAISSSSFEEPARDIAADESGTMFTAEESPLLSSFQEPQEDSVKESLTGAQSAGPAHELATEASDAVAPAFSEPQVASRSVEFPSAAVLNDNAEEPVRENAQQDAANKSEPMLAAEESPLLASSEELEDNPGKEPLVAAPSAGLAHGLATEASDNDAPPFSEPQVASRSVEFPSAAAPIGNAEEPAQEDAAEKSGTMLAAVVSPLASSLQEPEDDTAKESFVAAPTAVPAHGLPLQEDSGAYSDMAVPEPQAASTTVEEQSSAISNANFEAPAQEDASEKDGIVLAPVVSPSAASFEEPQEGLKEEILAPAQESVTREDSDVVPAFFEPQVAAKFVEEPLAAVPSANSEESAGEDADDTSGTQLAAQVTSPASSFEEPEGDTVKEPLVDAPSAGTAHELLPQVNVSGSSDMAVAEPRVASITEEDPPVAISSANFEEPAVEKSGTMFAAEESPFASSLGESHEDFAKESLAAPPSAELAQKRETNEESYMARASSDIEVTARAVEEPSAAVQSANFEEPAQEDVAKKNGTMLAAEDSPPASSFEDSQVDFMKESLAAAPSAEPARELAVEMNNEVAPAFSEPQVASRSVEYPSAAVPNTTAEEPAQGDAQDKSGTLLAAEESPLLSSSEGPKDNLVQKSSVAGASDGPAYELVTQEDSDTGRASPEPQDASRSVEEPSSAVPGASFEEPVRENAADKSETMLAAEESPLLSSSEKLEDNPVKESLVAAQSAGSAHELATQEDSNIAESQEASRFVEEPSAAIPSASFEEPAQEDVVDKSRTLLAAEESPLLSSSEKPEDNPVKEPLAAASSAGPAHGLASEASDEDAPAFSEPQVASKSVDDPSAAAPNDNAEEPAQEDAAEKSGTTLAAVVSPLASSLQEPEDDTVKESLVAEGSTKTLEPAQEEDFKNSAIAQEALVKEPSGGSVKLERPAQEKASTVEEPQNVPVGESNHAPKEVEYKLAEDVRVPDEHVKDTEEVFPKSQSNLAHVGSDERKPENLASQDSDERVESGESGEEFFDAEQESGQFEAWDSVAQKPFEESVVGLGEHGEASGSNTIAQKSFVMEPVVHAPRTEPAQELENFQQKLAQEHGLEPAAQEQELGQERGYEPAQELAREPAKSEQEPAQAREQQSAQEHEQQPEQQPAEENLGGKNDVALASLESLVSAKSDQPQELPAEEPLAAEPRVKFEEPAQANAADESDTRDLPFAFKVEEPRIDTIGSSSEENFSSARFYENGNPELVETLDEAGIAVPMTPAASASEESKEAPVNKPMKVTSSSEYSIESAQKGDDTATLQEPHEDFSKELSAAALSAFKSAEPDESSLTEEPRAAVAPTSAKLAQESGGDKSSPGLVEGSPLTSIEEELRYGSVSSLVKGKHGQNEVQLKAMEDVNTPPGLIEEAFPRSESDSTLTKLKPEERLESVPSEKHHHQGSFLAFAATPSVESKEEALEPAAKLVQLFEKEDVRKSGTVPAATFTRTEAAEQQQMTVVSSTAKVEKEEENHGRRRSFARSTSEPQFVYSKSGDHHRNTQPAKEPSVTGAPSASNLEQHAQEDSADVQCLPFKLLGEGKLRKESELKMAEDVHGSARKTEPATSYVLEPKPTRIKEKKKREKKDKEKEKENERKHEAPAEEKLSRRSFRSGEMERKGSVRGEDKDNNNSNNNNLLRSEEKHKQPFRHWRDKLRHAFGTTKDP